MNTDFTRLFHPRRVAVVGASPNAEPGRFNYLDYFTRAGFPGVLCPVNPGHREVMGHRCYPSLRDVPGEVDMAIFMIPAEKTVSVVRDLPEGKLRFAVVVSSGFAEVGKAGLEKELVRAARACGVRVLGPNCMGVYSRKGRVAPMRDLEFGEDPGSIGVVAQSGGHAINFVRAGINAGVGIHSSVSIGNQSDLAIEDFLAWYAGDPDVALIAAYLEDVKQARRFSALVREITPRKPVIVWKGGSTAPGARAAGSHTGAMALPQGIWQGVTRQTGILSVESIAEFIELARALLWAPLPQGPGVGILVPGGGYSVYKTDQCVRAGLEVPLLSEGTRRELARFIPEVNTITLNPMDMGATAYNPRAIRQTIAAMAREDRIHAFVLSVFVYPFQGSGTRESLPGFVACINELRATVRQPIYGVFYDPFKHIPEADEARREAVALLNANRIPYFTDMERCARAVRLAWDHARTLRRRRGDPGRVPPLAGGPAREEEDSGALPGACVAGT